MEERLEVVEVVEEDLWEMFDVITRMIFENEAPNSRGDAEDIACILRMKIDTACAMYNYERREK